MVHAIPASKSCSSAYARPGPIPDHVRSIMLRIPTLEFQDPWPDKGNRSVDVRGIRSSGASVCPPPAEEAEKKAMSSSLPPKS